MKNLSLKLLQDSELLGILLVCAAVTLALYVLFRFLPERKKKEDSDPVSSLSFVRPSRRPKRYTKKDFFAVTLITVLYAVVSFWQLGSTVFPTTTWQPESYEDNQSFILKLTEDTSFDQINILYEEGDNNANLDTWQLGVKGMKLEGSNDLEHWKQIGELENNGIYEYQILEGSWQYAYIRVTAANKNQTLTEIAFKKTGEDSLLPVEVYEDAHADGKYPASLVIDEQDEVAIHPTYMDEAYFDEIYHPRNAWEIANGQYMYATVHPLLGTNIMALFIRLFGMSPLVWRLPGVLFGIMIVPLFYAIVHLIFGSTPISIFGAVLCAGDFMHLTTSRIGTLEPFSVFFILCMFYFMMKFYYTNFYDTKITKVLGTLLLSGIFMGIAIATKWTACYSAVGLAVLLFTNLFFRFREYRKAKALLKSDTGITAEERDEALYIQERFPLYTWIVIGWCFVFFIIIPIIIYAVSYLPDHVWRDSWSLANVLNQNDYMYHYHMNLKATHPYQSTWYMWLVDARPIWYYSGVKDTGISHSISCFSNPLLTWAGLPALVYMVYRMIKDSDRTAWMILVGWATALGPWVLLVRRCVFAYHFYPTSFFTMLTLCYAAFCLRKEKPEKAEKYMKIFSIVYLVLFVMFLPATAGFGTVKAYIKFLEWFPTWYFG